MSKKADNQKGEIVTSDIRGLALKRATLVSRGIELLTELDNRQFTVSDKGTKKILIVDDDKVFVELLCTMVTDSCRHDATGIPSGFGSERELIERIYEGNHDILILNINMPGIKGTELTRRIRKAGLYLPVVLTTGHSIPKIALEAMRSGADDLLIKPFDMQSLSSSIDIVLAQRNVQTARPTNQQASSETEHMSVAHLQDSDVRNLTKEYYETGELMAELTQRQGQWDGVSKIYRRWGTPLAEVSFKDGLADGVTKWFRPNGQVVIEDVYENDQRKRRRLYDHRGKLSQAF